MAPSEKILVDVNPQQREAITHGEGPLLVVAGAGTGKTRVITRRIAYLVERGVAPWRILAITFTNKAAGEMRERVESLVGSGQVWISTFHSLAARILRRDGPAIDIPSDFTIYDAQDQTALVRDCISRLELDSEQFRAGAVLARISAFKRRRSGPEDAAREEGSFFDREAARVYDLYARELREAGVLDFDDLLSECLRLLESQTEAAESWRRRFAHVLIDEYQDTNRIQYLIARELSRHGNLVATGDPDQAIYSWRGADLRNILDFEEDFPGARIVKLEQNYRSTAKILAAASGVIRNNVQRVERELFTEGPDGDDLSVLACADGEREADQIARTIQELCQEGYCFGDVAVFYRINALSRLFEHALRRHDIPYVLVGGVAFYQRREVRDLLAYLRLLANPRDTQSLLRVINVPSRKIGKVTVNRLRGLAADAGLPPGLYLLEGDLEAFAPRQRRALDELRVLLRGLRDIRPQGLAVLFERLVESTRFIEYLEGFGGREAIERVENVHELAAAIDEYVRREPDADLARFLEETALVQDVDQLRADADHVTVMTLHAAKGLEFPVVFLVGLEEGLLPHARSANVVGGVEEERRLAYVGMTRARQRLYISHAAARYRYGQLSPSLPSPFLAEISAELLDSVPDGPAVFPEAWAGEWEGSQGARTAPCAEAALFDSGLEAADLEPEEPFGEGEQVCHLRFGIGTVLSVRGAGPSARVTVRFPSGGVRTFVQEYARLRRVPF